MGDATTRINESEQTRGKSEPSKHLKKIPVHQFDWTILSRALYHRLKRKIVEDYFMK